MYKAEDNYMNHKIYIIASNKNAYESKMVYKEV
jgi:hypothetical protein